LNQQAKIYRTAKTRFKLFSLKVIRLQATVSSHLLKAQRNRLKPVFIPKSHLCYLFNQTSKKPAFIFIQIYTFLSEACKIFTLKSQLKRQKELHQAISVSSLQKQESYGS